MKPARQIAILSVLSHFPVNELDLLGDKRQRVYVEARWAAAKVLFDHAGYSVSEIGRTLNRDHTTIMHGLEQIRKKMAVNLDFATKIALVEEEFLSRESGIRRALEKKPQSKTLKAIKKAMVHREVPSADKMFASRMSEMRFENAVVSESKVPYRDAISEEAGRLAREV